MYSYNPTIIHIFDMIGISLLSISTYEYNYNIYNRLNNGEIILVDNNNINYILKESKFIHLRSYLSIITNCYNLNTITRNLILSGVSHLYSIFLEYMNVIKLFMDGSDVHVFLDCNKIFLSVPVGYDCFIIFLNSPRHIAVPFLFINVMIIILLIVKPFDKMTGVAFQLLLIVQTYYGCLSSINSIYH
jgi:hypothetical protein